jgi:hypothetical protein
LESFLDWIVLQIENIPDEEFEARYGVYEANTEVQIQTRVGRLEGRTIDRLASRKGNDNPYKYTMGQ